MRKITLLIFLVLIIGCSNKSSSFQDKDIKYQMYLSEKADKKLDKEVANYDKE